MNTLIIYCGIALLVFSGFLIQGTSPYSSVGGVKYEKKRQRRTIAVVLLVVATMASGLGILAQFLTNNP